MYSTATIFKKIKKGHSDKNLMSIQTENIKKLKKWNLIQHIFKDIARDFISAQQTIDLFVIANLISTYQII